MLRALGKAPVGVAGSCFGLGYLRHRDGWVRRKPQEFTPAVAENPIKKLAERVGVFERDLAKPNVYNDFAIISCNRNDLALAAICRRLPILPAQWNSKWNSIPGAARASADAYVRDRSSDFQRAALMS